MHDAGTERVRTALSFIDPHDRKQWVDMAFALKDEYGEDGFTLWDEWGSAHERPANEIKSTWKSATPGGSLKIGTLFYRAKEAGWKDDVTHKKPSKAEIAKRKQQAEERAAAYQAQEAAAQEAAAEHARAIWAAAQPVDTHPYLERKGVPSHGLRCADWTYEYTDRDTGEVITATVKDCLLIPIIDRQREIHSLQGIDPKPGGKKRYLPDGAKRGHFYPIGKPQKDAHGRLVFMLGEGYATCASVHAATGHMVLVCFDASNLLAVARTIRDRYPDAVILFLADNDLQTAGNPGVTAANKAASEVGGLVAVPSLESQPDAGCDFNDLAQADGPEAVFLVIDMALNPPPVPPAPPEPPQPPEPEPEPEAEPGTQPGNDEPPIDPIAPEDGNFDDVDPSAHFTVLGYDRGYYWLFQHEQRQIHGFKGGELGADATMLMLAPLTWWEMYFPSTDKAGGLNKKAWLNWFFRVVPTRGIYDISRVRGRGAWMDAGRAVFHHGSHLTVDGQRVDVTKMRGSKYVYELSRTLPAPADVALPDEEGRAIVETARMFRWSKPGSAPLLAGFSFLAPICGALRWRPHIWINGGAGSGKSTILNEFVSQLLGSVKVFAQGNSTEAGIRQKLKADALPVLFDESEQNNDAERKRMDGVLALIRQSSTESDAETLKGTLSGESSKFHIRSMFCLASIQVGMDNKADIDRLTKLNLLKPEEGPEAEARWSKIKDRLYDLKRDDTLSARLLRRALDLLPVIHQNIGVFVKAAAKHFGSQRMGDQYGTLLAGCWSLENSTAASLEDAFKMIDSYDWSEFVEAGEEDDPERALRAVMEAKIQHKGEAVSVGTIITLAANRTVEGVSIDAKIALRLMRENGMNFSNGMVAFQNGSAALKKLIGDTQYATDLRGQLLRVKGAKALDPIRFGAGPTHRSVGIPVSIVLGDHDDEPL